MRRAAGKKFMLPDAGDIAWVEFDPVKGTEQAGRRPALFLTDRAYHENSRSALVCPITSNLHRWPFNVALPPGLKTWESCLSIRPAPSIELRACMRSSNAPLTMSCRLDSHAGHVIADQYHPRTRCNVARRTQHTFGAVSPCLSQGGLCSRALRGRRKTSDKSCETIY